jgi:hypothetical protein
MAFALKSSTVFLITCVSILIFANVLMLSGMTNYNDKEGFYNYVMNGGFKLGGGEGFENYQLSGAGTGSDYQPIGAYDNVLKVPSNGVSAWRDTLPNEPLAGPAFKGPSTDNLFMFKNNQCKPECCGSSFSCGGGCVCTTPEQRQMIANRGGNRTMPEDGI